MAGFEDLVPNFENPAEVAAPFARSVGMNGDFDFSDEEEILLPHLDSVADETAMFGTYFVTTSSAYSVPVTFDRDGPVVYKFFGKVTFEGPFVSHSLIRIGSIGEASIRALCLNFSEALLVPNMERIPESHLLHVPVLAVDDISRTDRTL